MLGLSVFPAVLQFIGFLFLPESPRWLIQRGLTQKARRVLSQIRGNQNIDEEYDSIKNSIDEEESGGGNTVEEGGSAQHLLNSFLSECSYDFAVMDIEGIETDNREKQRHLQMGKKAACCRNCMHRLRLLS